MISILKYLVKFMFFLWISWFIIEDSLSQIRMVNNHRLTKVGVNQENKL